MAPDLIQLYEFGPFLLNPEAHVLLRDGRPIPLTPKVFDTLVFLIGAKGRLVLKDDLIKAVWPDTYIADSNLTQTIFMLRKALGETAGDKQYIVTVPGRGYRFVGEVRQVASNGHSDLNRVPEAIPREAPTPKPTFRRHPWGILVTAGMFLAITAAAYLLWLRPTAGRHPVSGKRIVAVLPFENLTGDPEQDFFIDGLTAEIIVELGQADPKHLGVIARTSVMRYKKSVEQVRRIARELGVDYVLEGNVRQGQGKLRITADLIQANDQTHVWARHYDRETGRPLAIQSEIAHAVADEVKLAFGDHGPTESGRGSPKPESYEARDLYIKGRYFWNKRTPSGFKHAVELFQQAIANDPNFAPAYTGLADSYSLMSSYYIGRPKELFPKARSAALRALELDDKSAEAHTSLALIAENYDWDWQTAEKEYRRAIQLDPGYATAHHWYAELLGFEGQFDEALAESERARKLDPLSLIIATDNAAILYFAGQYEPAIEQLRVVLDMEPNFIRARYLLIAALVEKGAFTEALANLKIWDHGEGSPWTLMIQAYVYARMGRRSEAQYALQRFMAVHPETIPDTTVAAVLAVTGDKDKAIAWLQDAYAHRSPSMAALNVDHQFDPLRSDPRFTDLIRRIGLSQ